MGNESVVAPEADVAFSEWPGAPAWLCEGVLGANFEILAAAEGKEES